MKVTEGNLNERLLREGGPIFHRIPGFEHSVWARRIGLSDCEADFVLIDPTSRRLAVIECAKDVTNDVKQLCRYVRRISGAKPKSLSSLIKASLEEGAHQKPGVRTRAKSNLHAPLRKWLAGPEDGRLELVLSEAKNRMTAILLIYVVLNPCGRFSLAANVMFTPRWKVSKKALEWRLMVVRVG